jgi:hypothetical protein
MNFGEMGSNLCMPMQRHPCTFKEVPPTLIPSLVLIEKLPSPFEVLP